MMKLITTLFKAMFPRKATVVPLRFVVITNSAQPFRYHNQKSLH
jgi:hypothetical protein